MPRSPFQQSAAPKVLLCRALYSVALSALLSGCFLFGDGKSDPDAEDAAAEDEAFAEAEEAVEKRDSGDGEAHEVKEEDKSLRANETEEELLHSAKRTYQSGIYSSAQGALMALRDRYPLGAYGSWAAIKTADAHYFNGEFDKAANYYEEFLKNYPGSVDTPYVKLQAARAHLSSAHGIGRDRQPLERSLQLFDELEHDFPGTPYAVLALSERTPALDELVAYDRFIIDFYRKKGNDAAVQAREKLFQERWSSRIQAGEFKERSEEIPLEPMPAIEGAAANSLAGSESFTTPPEIIDPEVAEIRGVECSAEGAPTAVVLLSRFPEAYSAGNVVEKLFPVDGAVRVPDLLVKAQRASFPCFGNNDLRISPKGELELETSSTFELTTLDSPSRILLTEVAE